VSLASLGHHWQNQLIVSLIEHSLEEPTAPVPLVVRREGLTPRLPETLGKKREPESLLPRVFGRYVLFDRIGRGGMADIFLARADMALGGSRLCVLKQVLPELSRDPQFERLLIEEAKLAARLTHGNIVQVFDLGREDDRLFIVMEYVEGYDLNQLLRAVSRAKLGLPAEFALQIVRDALRALDYAHRAKDNLGRPLGLVHRDVSPSNLLVSFDGEVKLCDFGIARALSAHAGQVGAPDHIPAQARIAGKSAYMSPEQARGDELDARADVFAAGIILWELCAGRRLYRGSEAEMLAQAKRGVVPALPERGLPNQATLQAVLDRALATRREERFESAQAFLNALEEYAMSARVMASQLRLGTFLAEHFGQEIIELRRQRERAVRAVHSELPPAAPTLVSDRPKLRTPVGHERTWREPGASIAPPRGSEGPPSALTQLDAMPEEVSEDELENSLMGLDVLAQQTLDAAIAREKEKDKARVLAQPTSFPPPPALPRFEPSELPSFGPPPTNSHEWAWYALALAILLLGVLGYLFS
jgi:eukaryotic-like serine/threonine-protein kinase